MTGGLEWVRKNAEGILKNPLKPSEEEAKACRDALKRISERESHYDRDGYCDSPARGY